MKRFWIGTVMLMVEKYEKWVTAQSMGGRRRRQAGRQVRMEAVPSSRETLRR